LFRLNGKTTDKLIKEEAEITSVPNKREHDVLVATGEQITISKLCMCLEKLGYDAISYTGWQVPIVTNNAYGNARIKKIDTSKIYNDLENGKIVIVAGFQGVDEELNITTLGRGGSDTTAVAIAASLKADKCDIYTDVDGVYSCDPRLVEEVSKLDTVSYDEMLELASLGAKVLHNRCVEIGKNYNVPICVKSTFETESVGTLVADREELEHLCISGIAKEDNIVQIVLKGKNIYGVFKILADNDINVDMISQSFGKRNEKEVSFAIKEKNAKLALNILKENAKDIGISDIKCYEGMSKVSIVGIGIVNNSQVIADVFEILCENNINTYAVSSAEIKISVLVDSNMGDKALKVLHEGMIK